MGGTVRYGTALAGLVCVSDVPTRLRPPSIPPQAGGG